jgi:hypothetical protein
MNNFFKKLLILFFVGFVFSACSKDADACAPIACYNKGVANANCGCDCAPGFTGADCSTLVIPKRILITKIRVSGFPNYNLAGNKWDVGNGIETPDIVPFFAKDLGKTSLFLGLTMFNVSSTGNDTYDFVPLTPIEITDYNVRYSLLLYDDDTITTPSFEYMGGWDFIIYNSEAKIFPKILSIGSGNGIVKFQIYLTYEW